MNWWCLWEERETYCHYQRRQFSPIRVWFMLNHSQSVYLCFFELFFVGMQWWIHVCFDRLSASLGMRQTGSITSRTVIFCDTQDEFYHPLDQQIQKSPLAWHGGIAVQLCCRVVRGQDVAYWWINMSNDDSFECFWPYVKLCLSVAGKTT